MTLGLALAVNILDFVILRVRGPMTLERRAHWLRSACCRVMNAMGVRCSVHGALPERGLVVSNHLSYLDILFYGAAMPCFFVSKAEVEHWPYFGWAARTGGALFLERGRRSSTSAVAQEIGRRFALSVPVLLFPEGTSSDGSSVMRFLSGFFEPAIAAQAPVTAAAVRYFAGEGGTERDLCWFGDAGFLPHLWKVLGTKGFSAELRFAAPAVYADRRSAASATHEQVEAMRGRGSNHSQPHAD